MRFKKYFALVILLEFFLVDFAQNSLISFFNYQPFYSPVQKSPYIETYITVVGNSIIFKPDAGNKYQAVIEVTMLFKQENKIITFRKYDLKSPEIDDLAKSKPNFIDQQRIPIDPGIYNFELSIKDLNDSLNKGKYYTYHDIISIKPDTGSIDISGIELIETYSKSIKENELTKCGYDIIPYVSDYYPQNLNRLIFYAEIYNTDLIKYNNEDFLVSYFIQNGKNNTIVNDCLRFKKQKPSKVTVVFSEFNISKLISGNYYLVIEVKNRNNETLISRRSFFQRSNPEFDAREVDFLTQSIDETFVRNITNIDTLVDYLKCTRPVADRNEKVFIDNQVKLKNREYMQKFFYNFWQIRDNTNPERAWNSYLQLVKVVNKTYSTRIKKGYETDQGRVYLQYGAPDDITFDKYDPSAYPYEIWQYNRVNDQTNRRFVFYNPDLLDRDYILLHSDVKGEIAVQNWEMVLHKRDTPQSELDQNQGIDYYGGHAIENFNK